MPVLINGSFAGHVSATDRGLNYGDGLFETIAVFSGIPALWNQHISRLTESCHRLAFPAPDSSLLLHEVKKVIDPSVSRQVVKILLTRGVGGRAYAPPQPATVSRIISVHDWPDYPDNYLQQGVMLALSDVPLGQSPLLAGIKHTNRLEQVMARYSMPDSAFDTLMVDIDNNAIEASSSNLFVWDNQQLLTPELNKNGVSGVIRQLVIDSAKQLDITVIEREISVSELVGADGLFITNSIVAVAPVRRFDRHQYDVSKLPMRFLRSIVEQAHTVFGVADK